MTLIDPRYVDTYRILPLYAVAIPGEEEVYHEALLVSLLWKGTCDNPKHARTSPVMVVYDDVVTQGSDGMEKHCMKFRLLLPSLSDAYTQCIETNTNPIPAETMIQLCHNALHYFANTGLI